MTKSIQNIEDLTPDKKNANKGSTRGAKLIEHSLVECGAGRSIVVDRNGVVVGGNQILKAAKKLGLPIKPIQSNGDELIVVVREDLDMETDARARELALVDNRSSEVSLTWDAGVILDLQQNFDLDLSPLWSDEELDKLINPVDDLDLSSDDETESVEQEQEKQPCVCPNCGHTW